MGLQFWVLAADAIGVAPLDPENPGIDCLESVTAVGANFTPART